MLWFLRTLLCWGLGSLPLVYTSWAQEAAPYAIPRLTDPIVLDGLSDDAAWHNVAPVPLTMHLPVFAGTPTQQTEIRMGYDDAHLYIAGRFFDTDPASIRANSLYRDRQSGDDLFTVLIDPFGDNENALWFATTPAGVRLDQALANDGEDDPNTSWNAFWEVATVVNQAGWFAEMRIPFSTLGFQSATGFTVMGITVTRLVARNNELVSFPAISSDGRVLQPSRAQKIRLENVATRTPLYLTPYVLGGLGQTHALNAANTHYRRTDEAIREIGLDLKYNLTSNLTLDATLNTDFAQVEADDQQVNLTRFSLFFPEKRQFFQERAGIFEFDMSRGGKLFHSRRIGLVDGQVIPIRGGLRAVGRIGAWDVGSLTMQTARTNESPTENFGVVRLRRQAFNPFSYVGGLLTSRVDEHGTYQLAYGLDSQVRVFGDDYLSLKWAHTLDKAQLAEAGLPWQAGQLYVRWERRTRQGLRYATVVGWSGRDYNPAVGFANRHDFMQANGFVQYNRFFENHSKLRQIQWGLFTNNTIRNADQHLESMHTGVWVTFVGRKGTTGWIEPQMYYEAVLVPFRLSQAVDIPAGQYTYGNLWLNYQMTPGRLLRTRADLKVGTLYDGSHMQLSFEPTWNVSRHLEIGGFYEWNYGSFSGRGQTLNTHLFRLRVGLALNAQLSATTFVQYNHAADAVNANVRFRYNVREGHDLWLVYNEGLNTNLHRQTPALPRSNSRTLLVKYVYTFVY